MSKKVSHRPPGPQDHAASTRAEARASSRKKGKAAAPAVTPEASTFATIGNTITSFAKEAGDTAQRLAKSARVFSNTIKTQLEHPKQNLIETIEEAFADAAEAMTPKPDYMLLADEAEDYLDALRLAAQSHPKLKPYVKEAEAQYQGILTAGLTSALWDFQHDPTTKTTAQRQAMDFADSLYRATPNTNALDGVFTTYAAVHLDVAQMRAEVERNQATIRNYVSPEAQKASHPLIDAANRSLSIADIPLPPPATATEETAAIFLKSGMTDPSYVAAKAENIILEPLLAATEARILSLVQTTHAQSPYYREAHLGFAHLAMGNPTQGVQHLKTARMIFRDKGEVHPEAQVLATEIDVLQQLSENFPEDAEMASGFLIEADSTIDAFAADRKNHDQATLLRITNMSRLLPFLLKEHEDTLAHHPDNVEQFHRRVFMEHQKIITYCAHVKSKDATVMAVAHGQGVLEAAAQFQHGLDAAMALRLTGDEDEAHQAHLEAENAFTQNVWKFEQAANDVLLREAKGIMHWANATYTFKTGDVEQSLRDLRTLTETYGDTNSARMLRQDTWARHYGIVDEQGQFSPNIGKPSEVAAWKKRADAALSDQASLAKGAMAGAGIAVAGAATADFFLGTHVIGGTVLEGMGGITLTTGTIGTAGAIVGGITERGYRVLAAQHEISAAYTTGIVNVTNEELTGRAKALAGEIAVCFLAGGAARYLRMGVMQLGAGLRAPLARGLLAEASIGAESVGFHEYAGMLHGSTDRSPLGYFRSFLTLRTLGASNELNLGALVFPNESFGDAIMRHGVNAALANIPLQTFEAAVAQNLSGFGRGYYDSLFGLYAISIGGKVPETFVRAPEIVARAKETHQLKIAQKLISQEARLAKTEDDLQSTLRYAETPQEKVDGTQKLLKAMKARETAMKELARLGLIDTGDVDTYSAGAAVFAASVEATIQSHQSPTVQNAKATARKIAATIKTAAVRAKHTWDNRVPAFGLGMMMPIPSASKIDTIKAELTAYGEQHGLRGLEGRVQRGLDPAGMLAVTETRKKLEAIATKLGAKMEDVIALANELHTSGLRSNADRLASSTDPAVQVWMVARHFSHEGELDEAGFLQDYDRIVAGLDQALQDPARIAAAATAASRPFAKTQAVTMVRPGAPVASNDPLTQLDAILAMGARENITDIATILERYLRGELPQKPTVEGVRALKAIAADPKLQAQYAVVRQVVEAHPEMDTVDGLRVDGDVNRQQSRTIVGAMADRMLAILGTPNPRGGRWTEADLSIEFQKATMVERSLTPEEVQDGLTKLRDMALRGKEKNVLYITDNAATGVHDQISFALMTQKTMDMVGDPKAAEKHNRKIYLSPPIEKAAEYFRVFLNIARKRGIALDGKTNPEAMTGSRQGHNLLCFYLTDDASFTELIEVARVAEKESGVALLRFPNAQSSGYGVALNGGILYGVDLPKVVNGKKTPTTNFDGLKGELIGGMARAALNGGSRKDVVNAFQTALVEQRGVTPDEFLELHSDPKAIEVSDELHAARTALQNQLPGLPPPLENQVKTYGGAPWISDVLKNMAAGAARALGLSKPEPEVRPAAHDPEKAVMWDARQLQVLAAQSGRAPAGTRQKEYARARELINSRRDPYVDTSGQSHPPGDILEALVDLQREPSQATFNAVPNIPGLTDIYLATFAQFQTPAPEIADEKRVVLDLDEFQRQRGKPKGDTPEAEYRRIRSQIGNRNKPYTDIHGRDHKPGNVLEAIVDFRDAPSQAHYNAIPNITGVTDVYLAGFPQYRQSPFAGRDPSKRVMIDVSDIPDDQQCRILDISELEGAVHDVPLARPRAAARNTPPPRRAPAADGPEPTLSILLEAKGLDPQRVKDWAVKKEGGRIKRKTALYAGAATVIATATVAIAAALLQKKKESDDKDPNASPLVLSERSVKGIHKQIDLLTTQLKAVSPDATITDNDSDDEIETRGRDMAEARVYSRFIALREHAMKAGNRLTVDDLENLLNKGGVTDLRTRLQFYKLSIGYFEHVAETQKRLVDIIGEGDKLPTHLDDKAKVAQFIEKEFGFSPKGKVVLIIRDVHIMAAFYDHGDYAAATSPFDPLWKKNPKDYNDEEKARLAGILQQGMATSGMSFGGGITIRQGEESQEVLVHEEGHELDAMGPYFAKPINPWAGTTELARNLKSVFNNPAEELATVDQLLDVLFNNNARYSFHTEYIQFLREGGWLSQNNPLAKGSTVYDPLIRGNYENIFKARYKDQPELQAEALKRLHAKHDAFYKNADQVYDALKQLDELFIKNPEFAEEHKAKILAYLAIRGTRDWDLDFLRSFKPAP